MNFFDMTKVVTNENSIEAFDKADKELAISQSNIDAKFPYRFHQVRFNTYEPVVIVNTDGTKTNITKLMKDFSLASKNDKILLVSGPSGTGKTTLMCAGGHERAYNGLHAGLYLTSRALCPILRTSRSFSAKESELDIYEKYSSTPMLYWDEVGDCEDEVTERNFFRSIMAARFDNMLPMWISTNLTFAQFKQFVKGDSNRENDPIMDRLNSIIIPVTLNGKSYRTTKRS